MVTTVINSMEKSGKIVTGLLAFGVGASMGMSTIALWKACKINKTGCKKFCCVAHKEDTNKTCNIDIEVEKKEEKEDK